MVCASLDLRGNIFLILACYSGPLTEWPQNLGVDRGSEIESTASSGTNCLSAWSMGSSKSNDAWNVSGS